MSFELRRLAVRGLMSLRDVELMPGRVTVLIGPNGAGKSNLLAVFELLAHLHAGTVRRFVAERGPASALLHYGPKTTQAIEVEADFAHGDGIVAYETRLAHAPADNDFYFEREAAGISDAPDARPHMLSLGSQLRESRLSDPIADRGVATGDAPGMSGSSSKADATIPSRSAAAPPSTPRSASTSSPPTRSPSPATTSSATTTRARSPSSTAANRSTHR